MNRPETRFTWNGDVSLAYQVVGEESIDLLYLQGYASQVDMNWESPYLAQFLRAWRDMGGSSSPIGEAGDARTGSRRRRFRTSTR